MRISRLEIRNFRSIRHLVVDLAKTTVFIGPNNSGKTAILDALRIALSGGSGQRRKHFNEYDIRLDRESADPKTADGVSIVLWIEELLPDKWQDAVADNLNEAINLDARTEQRAISLQTEWTWDKEISEFKRDWGFLDAKGERKIGRSAPSTSLRQLCSYLPVFYLGLFAMPAMNTRRDPPNSGLDYSRI
ncbi:MAG: AAA family ATPase [Bacteroidota bacterium]|nr:AAA family ATPase [Bacteroidota bacterium]